MQKLNTSWFQIGKYCIQKLKSKTGFFNHDFSASTPQAGTISSLNMPLILMFNIFREIHQYHVQCRYHVETQNQLCMLQPLAVKDRPIRKKDFVLGRMCCEDYQSVSRLKTYEDQETGGHHIIYPNATSDSNGIYLSYIIYNI